MKEKSEFMAVLKLNNCELHIIGVIKGLEKESEKVREGFKKHKPEFLAISLSKEDLSALKSFSGKVGNAEPSNYEEVVYIRELKKFGKVKKPPPCYLTAVELAKESNVPCTAIDMSDEEYTDAFCRNVSTLDLYRHSWGAKKFIKKKFSASTPEEFVAGFDKAATSLKGYKMLEEEREKYMAERLLKLSKKWKSILAVVELERAEAVRELIEKMG